MARPDGPKNNRRNVPQRPEFCLLNILRVNTLRAEKPRLFPRLLKWRRRSLVERAAAHFLFAALQALMSSAAFARRAGKPTSTDS